MNKYPARQMQFRNPESAALRARRMIEILFLRRDGKTLKEIGQIMDISSERIREIIVKNAQKLRHPKYKYLLDSKDPHKTLMSLPEEQIFGILTEDPNYLKEMVCPPLS